MTDRFIPHGKQVLMGGRHFADARDDEAAALIATAMNSYREPIPSVWTAQKVQLLRDMVGRGLTSGVMARRLGVSRSAVISKCRRLGLRLRRSKQVAFTDH